MNLFTNLYNPCDAVETESQGDRPLLGFCRATANMKNKHNIIPLV